ncbi:MAG: hypothetical protein WED87_08925, partial [Dehalococcoidia bacterium]
EPLVEVNNAPEMERAAKSGAKVIGINNRDLRSFNVDLGTTARLAGMVPECTILAALSGIASREDVERFADAGASAVLVGEMLMLAVDPGGKVRELLALTPQPPLPTARERGSDVASARSVHDSTAPR